jgi:hypothetical protein
MAFGVMLLSAVIPANAWAPKQATIMTKWASQVDPKAPWPEYPRPQFVRKDWLNLNGIWQYQPGQDNDVVPVGKKLSSEILVPYPVESALSGVMETHERIWYRQTFVVPGTWKGRNVLLNFGAVNFESEVYINGASVGIHRGGYLPFSYDISPYLTKSGPQEIIVRVYNPVDDAGEPRGKQTHFQGGIMYTATTGIWQTAWLEPVATTFVHDLKITPDIDHYDVNVIVNAINSYPGTQAVVTVTSGGKVIKTIAGQPGTPLTIPIANARLWSPSDPFLYDLNVKLVQNGSAVDNVTSYFGMRKISIGMDHGIKKMFLNNKFLFEIGPLDQGFWPDGIYTAPSDAAVKGDIAAMKSFGFNMVRKHIKVEPARWYYWTDHLGLLVWQDMPSPNSYIGGGRPVPPEDYAEFETELRDLVTSHANTPSIVMWDIYNEGQGQFDTARLVSLVKQLDPTRLVNQASGGGYVGSGDVVDVHSYPPPGCPSPSATQALVCGEYGGIGFLVDGHTWKTTGGGYTNVRSPALLESLYGQFSAKVEGFRDDNGLSAAVYTQLTDVETELNGLLTYDRTFKCDPKEIALANNFNYPVPTYTEVVPDSEKTAQAWKYTFTAPPDGWTAAAFDDSSWSSGPGGFGASTPQCNIGTPWTTDDIWIRRTFQLGDLTPKEISELVIRDFHDEDIDVYVNGVLVYTSPGYITSYELAPIIPESAKAFAPNSVNTLAVHCHQTIGGQYIDAGFDDAIMPAGH